MSYDRIASFPYETEELSNHKQIGSLFHRVIEVIGDEIDNMVSSINQLYKEIVTTGSSLKGLMFKHMQCLLSEKSMRIFKTYFHVAMKGSFAVAHTSISLTEKQIYDLPYNQHPLLSRIDEKREGSNTIAERYEGQSGFLNSGRRYLDARNFLRSIEKNPDFLGADMKLDENDREGLKRIVCHRNIMKYYTRRTVGVRIRRAGVGLIVKDISSRIGKLGQCDSRDVVYHEDGSTSFSIPGGWQDHFISYEFKKELGDGPYLFIIHNRGDGSERNGGCFVSDDASGKIYAKTSLSFEIPVDRIECMTDSNFLHGLVVSSALNTWNADMVYDHIERCLLSSVGVKKRLSKHEDAIIKRALAGDDEQAMRLVKEDQSWHSVALYGTCSESNVTAPEKNLATPRMQRAIKLYSIMGASARIESIKTYVFGYMRGDAQFFLTHSEERISLLRKKISQKV